VFFGVAALLWAFTLHRWWRAGFLGGSDGLLEAMQVTADAAGAIAGTVSMVLAFIMMLFGALTGAGLLVSTVGVVIAGYLRRAKRPPGA
jgi:hypothetical protein